MNTNKSFSTETSERYARALFEIADENSEIQSIESNLKELLSVLDLNKSIENFIKNPTQTQNTQLETIKKISEIMKFSKNLKNFLLILVTKKRIFFINKIIKSFLKLSTQKKGELKASLVSSKSLTQEEIKKIGLELSKSIGFSLNLDYTVDTNLIGGLKIQLGSLMIDTSIKNKLKKYEQLMLER